MNAANHIVLTDALSAAELMSVGAVRSLDLLRAIDGTIEALSHHTQLFQSAQRVFSEVLKAISAESAPRTIREEDLIPALEALQDALKRSFQDCSRKMDCAIRDPRLSDDDGVVDAYQILLDALSGLNTTAENLRWGILENNADVEKDHTPVVLSNPSDIDSFLDNL